MVRLSEMRKQKEQPEPKTAGVRLSDLREMKKDKETIKPYEGKSQPLQPMGQGYKEKTLPGRDIPIIGPVLKTLDYIGEKTEPVAAFARSLYTPGAGVANVAGAYGAVGAAINKVAPGASKTLGGRVATEAIKEGVVGAPLAAGQSLASGNPSLKDAAEAGLVGGAFGAVTGGAAPLVGAGVKKLLTKTQDSPSYEGVNLSTNTGNKPNESKIFTEKSMNPEIEAIEPIKPVRLADMRAQKAAPVTDEYKFASTVKESENTAESLKQGLEEVSMIGARTSDILNRKQANDLITKHGNEGLHSILLAKTKQFSAAENTAAQILAKQFSSTGNKEDLTKAIELISKTAKGGREMGQAIQALSQWNKLDAEGALLMAERQLNKGVVDLDEWKSLTTTQATPITEAAQRIGKAQETKNLADEVLAIVTNKKAGEALTDVEKATIQSFEEQVKLINSKTKGFLPKSANKATETIKEVSKIEPKARTRDQVVNFLDAKAEKARQRIAASRNKISSTPFDIYADYAIIGASHIARGSVKLADFSAAMIRDFGEEIKPKINELFNKSTNIWRRDNGLPTSEQLDKVVKNAINKGKFTPDEAAQMKALAHEISFMEEGFKREATQDLQMLMKELGDSTLGQKLATVQTGAMLINPVTFERNALGNASQMLLEKISKIYTVPVDFALSKLTGEQRTIFFKTMNQEKFWSNFMIGTKSGWKGVSPTGTLDSYGVHPNVFKKNNPFKYVTKVLGASLQGFDYAFYNAAKGDVLATFAEQLGKAQGLSRAQIKQGMEKLIVQLDDRIHELADHAGRYATYQDDTLLSRGAQAVKEGLNEASTGLISKGLEKAGLPKKYSLDGFGVGDLVLKFAKTPANLVMRGLDYSPVGFIRSALELAPLVFNKAKFNQYEASRALGRAITGTLGLTGMGFVLADAGILSGSYSMDKDKRSIEEQSGQGSYKVNWSALRRFLGGGFDYKAAKFQEGDRLMDYAWLQPAAIAVAMGVNAQKEFSSDEPNIKGWQKISKALLGGLSTVLENPLVQGLSNVVDAGSEIIRNKNPDKLVDIVKGAPAMFVPTLLNQARTSTDNLQRETFDENLFVEMGNMIKNKIPGLSKTLPVSYNSLGKPREKIQGGKENTVSQYLTSFFSPARMTKYEVGDEAKLVLDLMEQSGDQNVLPRINSKYIMVDNPDTKKQERVDLTADQFSRLQKQVGEEVERKLAQMSGLLSNPNANLENKVKKVKAMLTDVGSKVRNDFRAEMGYKKKR